MLMSKVIGHRGVASLAPENTLAGIRKAKELGLEWIELDVTLLGGDQPVMFHDGRVNRTTGHSGHIKTLDLKTVREFDTGSWFSETFAKERIPTLIEALELVKELELGLNLELKVNRCNTRQLAYIAAHDLRHTDFPDDKLLVSSFSQKTLRYFHSCYPVKTGCLFERLPLNWQSKARQVSAQTIHLSVHHLSQRQAEKIKAAGYELYCYTVNKHEIAEKLFGWGVDGVFTDCPQSISPQSINALGWYLEPDLA